MCGRWRFPEVAEIVERFGPARVGDVAGLGGEAGEAVPGTIVPGLVVHRQERVVSAFRWGFFDDGTGHNARLETAAERPAWRQALAQTRLLLPLAAFVEGRAWFSAADGSALAVAGLYRLSPAGRRATMLTRPADPVIALYHDRMPVILPAGLVAPWLTGEPVDGSRLLTGSPPLTVVPPDRPGRTTVQSSRTTAPAKVRDQGPPQLFDDSPS